MSPGSAGMPAGQEKNALPAASRQDISSQRDGFPVVFLLDSEGRPSGSFTYVSGGPTPFIDALKRLEPASIPTVKKGVNTPLASLP